jgi:hypothetical protein
MNGKFYGSNLMMETYQQLQPAGGNTTWITEFKPIENAQKKLYSFAQRFFMCGICCAIVGTSLLI